MALATLPMRLIRADDPALGSGCPAPRLTGHLPHHSARPSTSEVLVWPGVPAAVAPEAPASLVQGLPVRRFGHTREAEVVPFTSEVVRRAFRVAADLSGWVSSEDCY